MLGAQQIVIDAAEFIKGMSSGAEISDGGFSSETEAVNPIAVPGVLYAPAQAVDSDTDARLTDEIIATSTDDDSSLGYERKMVTEDGKYYRYNGTKIPEAALRTDATNTYQKGFTDMISFDGETYATSRQTIIRWDESAAVFNASFFAFTNDATTPAKTTPHPAIVFEDNAFYGDGNLLLRQTAANATPATILTLSTEQRIIALGIDPGTGKMLISITSSLNISNTLPAIHKVLWYDGFSNKVLKSVIVDDMVTAFYSVGGLVFVGYGQNLGYLNGSGITFLRRFANVTLDQQDLPYKQNFTNIGDTLYVVDGHKILAYGRIIAGGERVFYYVYRNYFGLTNTTKFKCIFNAGQNKLGISSATAKFSTLDVASTPSNLNLLDVYTKWYHFPRPVFLRNMYIQMSTQIATSANFSVNYRISKDETNRALTVSGGTTTSVYELRYIGFISERTTAVKMRIVNSTENDGIKKIIIYYDWAD